MSNQQSKGIVAEAIKSLVKNLFKLIFMFLAWILRLLGMVIAKVGETIERIIVKKSSV
jgi:hypothetical protein